MGFNAELKLISRVGPDSVEYTKFGGQNLIKQRRLLQCSAVITRPISSKYSQKTPHSSPVTASYGVSFVGSASDRYSASMPAMMCAISCYVGLHYNSIRMYPETMIVLTHQTPISMLGI